MDDRNKNIEYWSITNNTFGIAVHMVNHNEDIKLHSIVYKKNSTFNLTKISRQGLNSADKIFLEYIIDNETIKISDAINGLYNNSVLETGFIDLESNRKKITFYGNISLIKVKDNKILAEAKSIKDKMKKNNICNVHSSLCLANLGDSACKIDLNAMKFQGKITKIINSRSFVDTSINKKHNYYTGGFVYIANKALNLIIKIHKQEDSVIILYKELPNEVKVGTDYVIEPGCDKRFKTCCNKFANNLNYQGNPFLEYI